MRPTFRILLFRAATSVALACGIARASHAQSLNWEGQTGGFVTPFAIVAESPAGGFGRPTVSFAALDAGDVVGRHFQISLAAGIAGRAEIGYTKTALETGNAGDVSELFDRGFQSVHVKVRLVGEDKAIPVRPSISVGTLFHWQFSGLDGSIPIRNADVYVVATKSIPAGGQLSVLLNGGVKVTNASAVRHRGHRDRLDSARVCRRRGRCGGQDHGGRRGPSQPKSFEGPPHADVPSTVSAFVRVTPMVDRLSVPGA